MGRPCIADGLRARPTLWPPLRLARLCREHESVAVVLPAWSPIHRHLRGGYMRSIALDVHRDFCEVAIKDESGPRLAGRVKSSVSELELFAQSLAPDDEVALEATGGALQIARILEGHVARVVIANTRKLSAIAESKVKTDKLDAKTLCELLAAGFLPAVFSPDEFTRALRRRLQRRSKLVSYVGLDPRVRQSGEGPARHGHISKQGSSEARHMLCEAAWVAVRTPGPLRAFYERVRARRGAQVALVATARKLGVLFWHLLTREEDYAFGRPSLTRRKLRALELKTEEGWRRGRYSGPRVHETRNESQHEREFAEQIETAYRRFVEDWQPKPKSGAGATRGRASSSHLLGEETTARQGSAPEPAL